MHQVRGRGAGESLQLTTRWPGPGWSAPIARLELDQLGVDQVRTWHATGFGRGEILQLHQVKSAGPAGTDRAPRA